MCSRFSQREAAEVYATRMGWERHAGDPGSGHTTEHFPVTDAADPEQCGTDAAKQIQQGDQREE